MLQRVAVIGGGAAGLCAARHILSRPSSFAPPVVFELSKSIGGTWCYDESVGTHSSMYRDLRTNLPKEVMNFPDFPFDPDLSSFLPHQEVQSYLERYCQSHDIRPHIRFNTPVEKVRLEGGAKKTTWQVTSSDSSGHQRSETFDSVFVCSGHYSKPHIPQIPGISNFKGQVLHSHSYRFAEPFSGLSVLILGAQASGLDISLELAKVGTQVQQAPGLEAVNQDGSLRFQDGSVGVADVLMFCTGYVFSYPFLDGTELGVDIQEHVVTPLYRFLFPPSFPSLFFIGLCKMICPFPHFDCQVRYALGVLEGSVLLPSQAQMAAEISQYQQKKAELGVERRHLLVMNQDQWEYCLDLARSACFPPLPPVVRALYEEVWRQRRIHPQNYRQINYRLVSATQWEVVEPRVEKL
ncbi:flavin-containing monooxygenase FMO GS-OX-like 4 isoform X2 [Gouania willdenowi]|uniref:flavin-containing monooxygenase FMO GS-OX-like 4 isoform X2 n=1 Tax=Gouania willdenowi TaxID=441366 RepID=UPI0010559842|nr:flavin-containing monooxygenase FMO GS-OX-like 4 isoform X2 [Gouania willdenowi]